MAKVAQAQGASAIADRMLPMLLSAATQQTQPQLVQHVRDVITNTPVPGIVGALQAMKERPDSTPLLGSIDVRTLVVVGQDDAITPPAVARSLTAAIPEAAMTTIAGAGHIAPLEAPTAVSRVIAEFLEALR
jgi:pimeloyl-ACP methyl ester carboxylesterase